MNRRLNLQLFAETPEQTAKELQQTRKLRNLQTKLMRLHPRTQPRQNSSGKE